MATVIGEKTELKRNFHFDSEYLEKYLQNVFHTLEPFKLEKDISRFDLLMNPTQSIKKAWLKRHSDQLPEYITEKALMDSLSYNFNYIQKNIAKVQTILKNYKVDKDGYLIEPDYNIYAENSEQEELYNELSKVVDVLNNFYLRRGNEFSLSYGMVAQAFSFLLHTDISQLPLLQVNLNNIVNYKLK